MKMEELVKVIEGAGLSIHNKHDFGGLKPASAELERNLYFDIEGVDYCINWYKNLMTLTVLNNSGMEVKFTRVEYTGTWPNGYKMNLQFYYGEICVCIIGLEKY